MSKNISKHDKFRYKYNWLTTDQPMNVILTIDKVYTAPHI